MKFIYGVCERPAMEGERIFDPDRFLGDHCPFDEALLLEIGQRLREYLPGDTRYPRLEHTEPEGIVLEQPVDDHRMPLPTEDYRCSDHGTPPFVCTPSREFVVGFAHRSLVVSLRKVPTDGRHLKIGYCTVSDRADG